MTGWLYRFFGRSEGRDADDNAPGRADPDARNRRGVSDHSARVSQPSGGDTTVRIDRSVSRLAWPARDETKASARPAEPLREERPGFDPHEEPTRLVAARPAAPRSEPPPGEAGHEELVGSRKPFAMPGARPSATQARDPGPPADDTTRLVAPTSATCDDPVVGWLVVIKGPGRGRSLELGEGVNSIGRAADQKVCLDFGDTRISRERHATVVFDPVSRRFLLHTGMGRGLTYLGNDPVLEPREIKPGDTIRVGDTYLHFIPYCGPAFSWS